MGSSRHVPTDDDAGVPEPWDGTFAPDEQRSEVFLETGRQHRARDEPDRERSTEPRSPGLLGRRGLVALGAAGLGAIGLSRLDDPAAPAPSSSASPRRTDGPSAGATADLHRTSIAGVTADWVPTVADLASLPIYPDSATLALPARLGWSRQDRLPRIPPGVGDVLGVRALMLRHIDDRRARVVLNLPGAEHAYVEIERPVLTDDVEMSDAQLASAIHPDRQRVAVVQPRAVHVVDVGTGRTQAVPVPDPLLHQVGWTGSGQLLAIGRHSWRLEDGRVRRLRSEAWPSPQRLVPHGTRSLQRWSYRGDGRPTGDRVDLPGPIQSVNGPTVTNLEGWSAAGVLVGTTPEGPAARVVQGVYAVQVDNVPRARMLLQRHDDAVKIVAMRPLLWGPRDHVVLALHEPGGMWLLAWDVIGGGLSRAGKVVGIPGAGDHPRRGEMVTFPML